MFRGEVLHLLGLGPQAWADEAVLAGGIDPAQGVVYAFQEGKGLSVAKKPEENPEAQGDAAPQAEAPAQEQQRQPQQRVQVQIDDDKALANYANFCRVTGTPEELIIDFGLNPQPIGVPTQPIPITQRIITNFYTAKRMLHALSLTVQRHEATFGVLEIDVQKRVRPGLMAGPPQQAPPQPQQ